MHLFQNYAPFSTCHFLSSIKYPTAKHWHPLVMLLFIAHIHSKCSMPIQVVVLHLPNSGLPVIYFLFLKQGYAQCLETHRFLILSMLPGLVRGQGSVTEGKGHMTLGLSQSMGLSRLNPDLARENVQYPDDILLVVQREILQL